VPRRPLDGGCGGVGERRRAAPASLIAADADDAPLPATRRRAAAPAAAAAVAGRSIDHRRARAQVLAAVEDDPLARLDAGDGDLLAARVGDLDRPRRRLRRLRRRRRRSCRAGSG
jgi:hypothetical protein